METKSTYIDGTHAAAVALANEVYHVRGVPFYKWFYDKLFKGKVPQFTDISQVPVLHKTELLAYQKEIRDITKNKDLFYFGKMIEYKTKDGKSEYEIDGAPGFTLQISASTYGNEVVFPTHWAREVEPVIAAFYAEPVMSFVDENIIFFMQDGGNFLVSNSYTGTSIGNKRHTLGPDIPMTPESYKAEIAKFPECKVIWFGYPQWLQKLMTIDVVRPEHYLLYMPKYEMDYGGKLWSKYDKKIEIFLSTELGILGYRTSWCSDQRYHFFRDDLFPESIDDDLVVTIDRPAFPMVRYNQEDLMRTEMGKCSCGRVGYFGEFLGRKVTWE